MWFLTETSGGFLWPRYGTFVGFHNWWGISWPVERLLSSKNALLHWLKYVIVPSCMCVGMRVRTRVRIGAYEQFFTELVMTIVQSGGNSHILYFPTICNTDMAKLTVFWYGKNICSVWYTALKLHLVHDDIYLRYFCSGRFFCRI
jgi:hypothetical protein